MSCGRRWSARTRILNDVRNQLSVGLVPPSDVLTIEAQQARQRMLIIEAENIVETAAAEFKRLVGLDQDVPVRSRSTWPPVDCSSGSARAFQCCCRPREVRAESGRTEIASLSDHCGATSALPPLRPGVCLCLTAIGGYDMARPNPRIFPIQEKWKPSWDIGVNVRWSLFDGGRVRAETAEAAANRRAVEARLRDFDAGVRGGSTAADG